MKTEYFKIHLRIFFYLITSEKEKNILCILNSLWLDLKEIFL